MIPHNLLLLPGLNMPLFVRLILLVGFGLGVSLTTALQNNHPSWAGSGYIVPPLWHYLTQSVKQHDVSFVWTVIRSKIKPNHTCGQPIGFNAYLSIWSSNLTKPGPSGFSCPYRCHVQMSTAQQDVLFSANGTKWCHSQGVTMYLDLFFSSLTPSRI